MTRGLDGLVDERRAGLQRSGLERRPFVASPWFDPVRLVVDLGEDYVESCG
jgi:hypothetical protein